MQPTAVVMNMFYTGLGIARSLGEHDVPVIGLTAQRRVYGNFTRYAKTRLCPDSRNEPEALLAYLLELAKNIGHRAIIFPTRDHDVVFLDRFREQLAAHFMLVLPEPSVLEACLNKWETYQWACRAGVAAPQCWLIETESELHTVLLEIAYPCVLKPIAAHHWRQGDNWKLVGGRKAIQVSSREQLIVEYEAVSRADKRVLVQQMVPGGDDALVVAACYLDVHSNWVAGFTAQKLVQSPEGFGSGCIVQSTNQQELYGPTVRLLQAMRFTGIAEVEYKWDAAAQQYSLIEINPRPWDQHRLGRASGVDLIYSAYCDYAGLPAEPVVPRAGTRKWVADDLFLMTTLELLWKRSPKVRDFLRQARGKRMYAIWSASDPLPFLLYIITRFVPDVIAAGLRVISSRLRNAIAVPVMPEKGGSGV